jgi:DNA-binding XRE family transcriptional regulator
VTVAGYLTVAQRNLTCAIRIRERRRELGLTQAEVVERVSRHGSRLSSQALSAIENGRRLPVGRLPDLAEALGCTVTYLLGLTAEPGRWQPDPQATPDAQVTPDGQVMPDSQATPDTPVTQDPSSALDASPAPRAPAAQPELRTPPRHSWILGPDIPAATPRRP